MPAAKRLRLAALAASPPQRPRSKPEVAIRDLRAHAVSEPESGRRWIVVAVETDSGLVGYAETAAEPDPATARAAVLRYRDQLIGHDALGAIGIERLLDAAPARVRAAVDVALLDIRGKHVGAPVYELLTGRTRDKVRALAVLSSDRPEAVAQARSAGFLAFSVPLSIPTGPTRGRTFYSDTFERVSRLRRDAEDFALDCGGHTSPAEAAALATKFESFHLLWMDEPAADMNDEALRKISDNTVTPLGWGRSMPDPGALQDLLRLQVVDVFRPDITLMGLSRARRGSALAEAYYTAVAPYQRYGPISTAAAIQLAAAVPNCFAVDVPIPAGERGRSMRADLGGDELERPSDGFLELPQGPGLGIEVDEGALRKYAAA